MHDKSNSFGNDIRNMRVGYFFGSNALSLLRFKTLSTHVSILGYNEKYVFDSKSIPFCHVYRAYHEPLDKYLIHPFLISGRIDKSQRSCLQSIHHHPILQPPNFKSAKAILDLFRRAVKFRNEMDQVAVTRATRCTTSIKGSRHDVRYVIGKMRNRNGVRIKQVLNTLSIVCNRATKKNERLKQDPMKLGYMARRAHLYGKGLESDVDRDSDLAFQTDIVLKL